MTVSELTLYFEKNRAEVTSKILNGNSVAGMSLSIGQEEGLAVFMLRVPKGHRLSSFRHMIMAGGYFVKVRVKDDFKIPKAKRTR